MRLKMEVLMMWENGTRATKIRKRGDVDGSHGNVWMEVEGLLGPYYRIRIAGGEIYRIAGDHLKGVCIPYC